MGTLLGTKEEDRRMGHRHERDLTAAQHQRSECAPVSTEVLVRIRRESAVGGSGRQGGLLGGCALHSMSVRRDGWRLPRAKVCR